MTRRTGVLLSALMAVGLAGCGNVQQPAAGEEKWVATEVVSRQSVEQTSQLTGTLEPVSQTPLSFEIGGRVVRLTKEPGDRVAAGEEIGRLDSTVYETSVRRADAAVSQARAALEKVMNGPRAQEVEQAGIQAEKARINADFAKSELERIRKLFEAGAVSRETLDQAVLRAQTAEADARAAETALALIRAGARDEDRQSMQSGLQQAEVQKQEAILTLQKTRLNAPFSGVVVTKLASEGQWVSPGTPIYLMADIRELKVVLQVPDREISGWSVGDPVVLDLYGSRKEGKVRQIYPTASASSGTIGVEIRVDNRDGQWVPGQIVAVEHSSGEWPGLFVPVTAVIRSGGGKPYVFVVKDGKAVKTEVDVGRLVNERVEIRSGLRQGDAVVVSGADRLLDGDPVRVGTGGTGS